MIAVPQRQSRRSRARFLTDDSRLQGRTADSHYTNLFPAQLLPLSHYSLRFAGYRVKEAAGGETYRAQPSASRDMALVSGEGLVAVRSGCARL